MLHQLAPNRRLTPLTVNTKQRGLFALKLWRLLIAPGLRAVCNTDTPSAFFCFPPHFLPVPVKWRRFSTPSFFAQLDKLWRFYVLIAAPLVCRSIRCVAILLRVTYIRTIRHQVSNRPAQEQVAPEGGRGRYIYRTGLSQQATPQKQQCFSVPRFMCVHTRNAGRSALTLIPS